MTSALTLYIENAASIKSHTDGLEDDVKAYFVQCFVNSSLDWY